MKKFCFKILLIGYLKTFVCQISGIVNVQEALVMWWEKSKIERIYTHLYLRFKHLLHNF